MNTVCIYIDNDLDHDAIESIKSDLLAIPHVCHVQMQDQQPHDVAIEFEAHHDVPMTLLHALENKGLHADIFSC